jgi:hypothetical protein
MPKQKNEDLMEVVDWLDQGKYDCMVTLTFRADVLRPNRRMRRRISDEVAVSYLGKLISRYLKATQARKSKKKIIMVPLLERTTLDEPHFHILMRLQGEDVEAIKTQLAEIWIKVARGVCGDPRVHDKTGEKWFLEISNPEDRRRIIEYVIKWRTNLDGLVLKYTHLGPVKD